jgi:hypothetical protein
MKSILVKIIAFAAAASVLALVGGYGLGYDARAVAATKPQMMRFSSAARPGLYRFGRRPALFRFGNGSGRGSATSSGPWPERRLAVRLAPMWCPGGCT